MKNAYIELGISPSGIILVMRQVIRRVGRIPMSSMLSDLEKKNQTERASLIGQILITSLGVLRPELKAYALLPPPPETIPFPTDPPPHEPRGAMRPLRVGLGLDADINQPDLLVQAYDGYDAIGEAERHSPRQLAELDKITATAIIGYAILQKLAAQHPDVAVIQLH